MRIWGVLALPEEMSGYVEVADDEQDAREWLPTCPAGAYVAFSDDGETWTTAT